MTASRRVGHHDEEGAVAVLVALCMTLLFLFAAVAIDATGFGYNERRQDQSAADVGALAAVQFAVPIDLGNGCTGTGLTRSRCNGAMEAMAVANTTLDDPSLADWTDASRCAAPPTGYTVSPITNCVAFNSNNQRAWVRIPLIERPTTLARAVGIDSISITADAIAGAGLGGRGPVLPFLIVGEAIGSGYNCLKAGSNPDFGPCSVELPDKGNFMAMDFLMYGNADLGYSLFCDTGQVNARLNANIARGIDHPLGTHPTGTGVGKHEYDHCPDFSAEPDMADGLPGNRPIEQGFLYGGTAFTSPASNYPGRLQVSSGGAVVRRSHPMGTPAARVDSTPLWTFLSSDHSLGGTPCDRSTVDSPSEMIMCISWAKTPPAKVVFNDSLASSVRFGFTPQVWDDGYNPGKSADYYIRGFLPVYVDTTFFGCQANQCEIMHTPGVADQGACPNQPDPAQVTCGTNPPSGGDRNASLDAVTAYILSLNIVPPSAISPTPGADNQRVFNLIR